MLVAWSNLSGLRYSSFLEVFRFSCVKMEPRILKPTCVLFILCFVGAAYSAVKDFPKIDDLEVAFFQAEVQVTDLEMQGTAYATEYYDNIEDRGMLKVLSGGDMLQIYFDNSTYEVYTVNSTTCEVWDADISEYVYRQVFYGWVNMDPIMIGPTAAIFNAQKYTEQMKKEKGETIRGIPCDKYSLRIKNEKTDDVTLFFYFARTDWTTPYEVKINGKKLRVPVRIQALGKSSRDSADSDQWVPVNQINDYAYFKPTIDDELVLEPPIGIGCKLRAKVDDIPPIPSAFQLSAEVVDLFKADNSPTMDIEFLKVWFDYDNKRGRYDAYSKKKAVSELHDFKTGVIYSILEDRSCKIKSLKNSYFEAYDLGIVGRIKEPKEVLYLHGDFYEMGQRKFRGMTCNAYESVLTNVRFKNIDLDRLVVTVFFLSSETKAGVNGEMESQMPVYILLTGWDTPTTVAVKMQYNIFEFDDIIWPDMWKTFKLERCYPNPETSIYFTIIMEVPAEIARVMEGQGDLIDVQLRAGISKYAQVDEMRIPFMKIDYKPSGVFAMGQILERPPALIQFYLLDSGETTTKDPDLKIAADASNLEECAYACIDEPDFPCKGFFFCNQACFLKSVDPAKSEATGTERDLGICDDYVRTEGESTNFRDTYLYKAMQNLQQAVLDGNFSIGFMLEGGMQKILVRDLLFGTSPDADVNTGEKPYRQVIQYRKLNRDDMTTTVAHSTETLPECYKKCKEAEDLCSSFSFCPLASGQKDCYLSSKLILDETTNKDDLTSDRNCFVYHLKFKDYFTAYEGKVVLVSGDDVINKVETSDECAQQCKLSKKIKCRGFEYCPETKTCTLHKNHILDMKPEDMVSSGRSSCTHYSAKYITDYDDMGVVLVVDDSDVRQEMTLEQCAKTCSEEMKDTCKSFNYCPPSDPYASDGSCSLSSKLLTDSKITTTEKDKCHRYEKKPDVMAWKTNKITKDVITSGYTSKGFGGLVVGMIALGLIIGAVGFVTFSYFKAKNSGEGMTIRFMKQSS